MTHPTSLILAAFACAFIPVAAFAQSTPAPAASPDLSQYKTADALWLHIQDLKKGPSTPPKTLEEYRAIVTAGMTQITAATAAFLTQYPDDPRKWDDRLLQIEATNKLNEVTGHANPPGEKEAFLLLANDKGTPSSVRAEARFQLFNLSMRDYMSGAMDSATVIAQLNQFIADFPTYPQLDIIKWKVAQALAKNDPADSDKLIKELAASGQGQVADLAKAQLALKEKLKAPLDLHFTAVDGTPVDISKLRGKVVLVDFWATWCGPCRAELPDVLAVYSKLHSKGFEIIGISLDQDKDALVKFTAQNGMTWPQYFDGKGWQNDISSSFGINSIPAMWLINKKGYVATTNGREGLEDQVERLLAGSPN
jgi:thiol-disulfide isomerase/thioredoxin